MPLGKEVGLGTGDIVLDGDLPSPPPYSMAKTASLYDNFCKTGNYVIYDVIIWVQDGNCKKWLERILILVRSTI